MSTACKVALLCACTLLSLSACTPKKAAPKAETKAAQAFTEKARYGLSAEQASKVLFEVGERKVTLGEFADRLHEQSPYLRARYASPERRREFLENMIRFELLAHEASAKGYAKDAEVVRAREDLMVDAMMRKLFDEQAIKPESISDSDVAAYYDAHREDFRKPAQVRASQIVLRSEAEANKVLAEALAAPEDMDAFATMAFKKSIDPATRARLGDLRFFSKDKDAQSADVPSEVRRAAFELKEVGEVYPKPIRTPQGFHILKLTARRDSFDRTLEDAKPLIRNQLWRHKRQEAIEHFVAELRKQADIQEDVSLLATIPLNTNESEHPPK